MAELKRLSTTSQKATATPKLTSRLTFGEGFYFGLGLWTASFVFSFVIIPALICAAFIVLSILGISAGQILSHATPTPIH